MKPAMPAPIRTSACSTLTAAMTPRKRFVVPSCGSMGSSKRTGLMRVREALRRPGLADRFVQQLPAFARHPGGFRHRAAEMVELAGEVLECRLQAPAQFATPVGKEHVRDRCTDDRADTAHDAGLRFFRHS